jgi:hypothetical protein
MIRRFLFGVFWTGMFWIGLMTIGAGIFAGQQPASAPSETAPTIPPAAAAQFRARYGWPVLGTAAALAAVAAWRGWLPGTRK